MLPKISRRRSNQLTLLIAALVLAAVGIIVVYRRLEFPDVLNTHRDTDFDRKRQFDPNQVIILRWTRWFQKYLKSPVILTQEDCPYLHDPSISGQDVRGDVGIFTSCRISFDRMYLHSSDAVVFHSEDLISDGFPNARGSNQLWIYQKENSPSYTKDDLTRSLNYPNIFNWTMTYRRDSDVYFPYGHVVPLPMQNQRDKLKPSDAKFFTSKPRLALYFNSQNKSVSKRENWYNEMKKHIPIDVYGKLGKLCESNSGSDDVIDCYARLGKHYKFYLSFENSLCFDYITEKFFKPMNTSMVPVILGGNGQRESENYVSIAPNFSFVDARKYKSAKSLANYLQYLSKNDDEYLKYFEWKLTYQVVGSQGWCNLCQKVYSHRVLREMGETPGRQWYSDMWKWWNYRSYQTTVLVKDGGDRDDKETSACVSPSDFK